MFEQQGDVLLCQTDDGGEINVENGLVQMSGGLETALYLSLFGGNEDDDGRPDNSKTWWGNRSEPQAETRYTSETQYLLRSIPAIPANLRRIEQAVLRDAAWMLSAGVASDVSAEASIPGFNQIKIVVKIDARADENSFEYTENWKAST